MIDHGYLYKAPPNIVGWVVNDGSVIEEGEIVCTTFGRRDGGLPLSDLLCAKTLNLYAGWAGGEGVLVVFNGEPIERVRAIADPSKMAEPIRWEETIVRERLDR